MAGRKNVKRPLWVSLGALLLCAAAGLAAWSTGQKEAENVPAASPGTAEVYFLDVGQGDSELIRLPDGRNILIDAGTGETSKGLSQYLKKLNVAKLDVVIATHPHEDHIGGMAQVIRDFQIDEFVMPRVDDSQTPTTRTYESMLDALSDKNMKITAARAGLLLLDSEGARLELAAPTAEKYSDLNDYSAIAKLTIGKKSFLFTGDAGKASETEMLKKEIDLKCDVLKVGHHGSSGSTTSSFLKAASPGSAVISCGKDNTYGHPHSETMERLNKAETAVYRTDEQGTILVRCDGKSINYTTGLESVR